jgi:hypothetical protein
MDNTLG